MALLALTDFHRCRQQLVDQLFAAKFGKTNFVHDRSQLSLELWRMKTTIERYLFTGILKAFLYGVGLFDRDIFILSITGHHTIQ